MTHQPELFDNPDKPPLQDITGELAALIAARAPRNPYAAHEERKQAIVESRGEDLAAEQTGLRQVELPRVIDDPELNQAWHAERRLPPKKARTIVPVRSGPIRGESESECTPAGRETDWKLDDTTKAIGRSGLKAARSALGSSDSQKQ